MDWEKKSYKYEEDSRALLNKDLLKFEKGGVLYPYVQLVKEYPEELQLCFRGNSESNPRISIYYNNNVIFTVLKSGKVIVSFNHARYSKKWEEYYKTLTETYKFKGKIIYEDEISIGEISRAFRGNPLLCFDDLKTIYEETIRPMFKEYFDASKKEKAKDYFKNKECIVKGKAEKICQQALYYEFHSIKDGYFFYDLEFSQRHKNSKELEDDINKEKINQPDMWALHFNGKGKPDKIVMVEVKSTEAAMAGKSGIVKHMKKMKSYDKVPARIKEAYQIMNQYAKLGLRGLSDKDHFDVCDFKKLTANDLEILLIFTGEAKDIWESDAFKEERKETEKLTYTQNEDIALYRMKNG